MQVVEGEERWGTLIDADLVRLELVNGERVLPINGLAAASGEAEWCQLFLDFTFSDTYGSKEGSEFCG